MGGRKTRVCHAGPDPPLVSKICGRRNSRRCPWQVITPIIRDSTPRKHHFAIRRLTSLLSHLTDKTAPFHRGQIKAARVQGKSSLSLAFSIISSFTHDGHTRAPLHGALPHPIPATAQHPAFRFPQRADKCNVDPATKRPIHPHGAKSFCRTQPHSADPVN